MGGHLFNFRSWLAKIGGVVVIIFGLHMIGVFRIPFLEYDVRVHTQADLRWALQFVLPVRGVFFSGLAPCVGPIWERSSLWRKSGSVSKEAIGRILFGWFGHPLLVAALGVSWVTTHIQVRESNACC